MMVKRCICLPTLKVVLSLLHIRKKHNQISPADIVKTNTKEAFDWFYAQDDYINKNYLEPIRLSLYKFVSEYCAEIPLWHSLSDTIRIIDIGCGTGHMLKELQSKLNKNLNLEIFGLDFASTGIDKAKKLLPSGTFVVEDIYQNSMPSDYFNLVLCIETLEHLHLPNKALNELWRMCKPGGNIVVTVPNGDKDTSDGHVNFWSVTQLEELLLPFGLVNMKLLHDDKYILAMLVKQTASV